MAIGASKKIRKTGSKIVPSPKPQKNVSKDPAKATNKTTSRLNILTELSDDHIR